jgi:UPF0755 protein
MGGTALGWLQGGINDKSERIIIPEGASIKTTAHLLFARGLIHSDSGFIWLARVMHKGGIKAGAYRVKPHMSALAVYDMLVSGKTEQLLVTIPEGMPAIMVQERLAATKDLTGPAPLPQEGSVLPDSYAYEAGETRADVLDRMKVAMSKALDEAWSSRSASAVPTSREQAITLASIVEKETAKAEERPLVAGVYSNRLRLGMKLQADPTVIYPVTHGKPLGRRIRKSELETDNGYNTYLKPGLPRGPIANPGRAAIAAVLNPASTKALYFVANGSGGHIFSETLAGQNENVRKWFALRHERGEM